MIKSTHILTHQITSLINPANDNMLAPWMTALEKAEELVEALKATCNVIASRPIMNPGQQALRAIAQLLLNVAHGLQ